MSDEDLFNAEFDSLVQDMLTNPEKVDVEMLNNLNDEQILELQKRMNPYGYTQEYDDEKKRAVIASYTNLREDYIRRFTMTSLVAFIFRLLAEWEVPTEVRRWQPKSEKRKKSKNAELHRGFTAEDLFNRAKELTKIAEQAKKLEEDVEKNRFASNEAEVAFQTVDIESVGKKLTPEQEERYKKVEAEYLQKLKASEASKAALAGILYVGARTMYRYGKEADRRIDSNLEEAMKYPQISAMLAEDPLERDRVPSGHREVPQKVAKGIITNFLRNWFEFDPDAHVRSAYNEVVVEEALEERPEIYPGVTPPPKYDPHDPDRVPLSELTRKYKVAPNDFDAYEVLSETVSNANAALSYLRDADLRKALAHASKDHETLQRFRRYLSPAGDREVSEAFKVIPPQDTFHRWGYYVEVNYDKLRAAVESIYEEKPDLDWAVLIYETLEGTPKEVQKKYNDFVDQKQDEVASSIKLFDVGQWVLLADFKENREKIEFLNKHTNVLKRIFDRHAEDKKVGAELMKNRIRQAKAKNIREAGPDAKGLRQYRGQENKIGAMGAEKVISNEEMLRLEKARGNIKAAKELEAHDQYKEIVERLEKAEKLRKLLPDEARELAEARKDLAMAKEMLEVPDDAIQIDVWTHDAGKGDFAKSKIFTKAVAPKGQDELKKPPQ